MLNNDAYSRIDVLHLLERFSCGRLLRQWLLFVNQRLAFAKALHERLGGGVAFAASADVVSAVCDVDPLSLRPGEELDMAEIWHQQLIANCKALFRNQTPRLRRAQLIKMHNLFALMEDVSVVCWLLSAPFFLSLISNSSSQPAVLYKYRLRAFSYQSLQGYQ